VRKPRYDAEQRWSRSRNVQDKPISRSNSTKRQPIPTPRPLDMALKKWAAQAMLISASEHGPEKTRDATIRAHIRQ
jgi:hypothetical protein